jgi:hypothetical protein
MTLVIPTLFLVAVLLWWETEHAAVHSAAVGEPDLPASRHASQSSPRVWGSRHKRSWKNVYAPGATK